MHFEFSNFVKTPDVRRPWRVSQMSQTGYNIDNKFQLVMANMDPLFLSGMLLCCCICMYLRFWFLFRSWLPGP